jgi:cell wall assembly regulator SMI1
VAVVQKFTRALTREIVVGGERLAVTLSEEGLSYRVVGSRKPPYDMTWAACLCACTQGREHPPSDDEIAAALKLLRAGGKEAPAAKPASTDAAPTPTPMEQSTSQPPPAPLTSPLAPAPAMEPPAPAQPGAERTTREPAAKPAMATVGPLPALLARVDAWFSAHRPRFAKALLPGATAEQLAALEIDLGFPVPEELHGFLAWHNGQNAEVVGAFLQSWHLLGTRRIDQLKKELDEEPSAGWNSAWIPFLDDGNGNYACVDSRQAGFPVRESWRGKQEHAVVAASLTAWVEQFVTDLEKGDYAEDPERGEFYKK